MTEKELIKKLNNLKNISPEDSWKKTNREILLSQVCNTSDRCGLKRRDWFFIFSKNLLAVSYQPVLCALVIVFMFFSSMIILNSFYNYKPVDSLYIARVISEKAQLSTIFDSKVKDRLALKFAAEHAKDIINTLADPDFNNEGNQEAVVVLQNTLKAELSKIKGGMNVGEESKPVVDEIISSDGIVYSADFGKDEKGLQVSTPAAPADSSAPVEEIPVVSDIKVVATSTEIISLDPMAEVQQLIDDKNYGDALNKLRQVEEAIK